MENVEVVDEDYYPFGGYATYNEEARDSTTHLNKERLAWVESKIKELES